VKKQELSIGIGFPCGGTVPWRTAMSLARTVLTCAKSGIEVDVHVSAGGSIVTVSRSTVLTRFLESNGTHLFWIDSDMEWSSEDFLRMVALGTQMDVVCAAYATKTEPPCVNVTLLDGDTVEMNKFGCMKIASTGLGFTIVSRAAIEKLAATKPRVLDGQGYEYIDAFRLGTKPNPDPSKPPQGAGEDTLFFDDLRELGYDAWMDPTVQLGHVGMHTYFADVRAALGLQEHFRPKGETE